MLLATLLAGAALIGYSAAPDPATVYAWYQGEGLARQGAFQNILSWTNSATTGTLPSSRNLTQLSGSPIAWNVIRPGGRVKF
mgnify:CR=1 FL=1